MPTFREDPKIGTKVPLIKTADLNDKSVTEKKLADGSITNDKIATGAVTSEKLKHNAVTTETINDGAVTSEKIAEGAVSVDEIKDLSVEESKINNKAVTNVKIDDAAVDTRTIEDKSVTNAKIADESITQEKIFNSSVTTEKIADESVSAEKLQSGLRSTIVSTHDKAIELDKKKANVTDVDYALERLENKIGDRVVVEGNVTNLPDDEDLTSVSTIDGREVMKLNDRAYEPSNFSGKGYKILRKNIQRLNLPTVTILVSNIPSSSGDITITINGKTTTVALDVATDTTTVIIATKIGTALKASLDDYDVSVSSSTIVLTRNNSQSATPSSIDVGNTTAGISVKDSITKSERKNVLTQDMINEPNTVYEIRYDFDLNGQEITLRDNCVLRFKGGVLKNGTIYFKNTNINANSTDIIFKNVEITGTIIEKERYAHWFEYKENHDDWNLISTLFNSPGNVYLEPRTYNVDKSIHTLEFINLSSNLNVYGCENCELNANHTSLQEIDFLFILNSKVNIKFDNITINCTIGTSIKPPILHGNELYDSSGLYIFAINNYCVGVTLKNMVINNAAFAIKTSRNTAYSGDVYFKDITIENCEFICDMPIQGTNYSNLVCKNSRFLSRGTNTGNHAVYVLPIVEGNYSKNIYFDNCYFYSPQKDGYIIQIYASNDTHPLASVTTFTNCLIEGTSGACITASSSAKVMLNNCTLKNAIGSICGANGGYIIAYNCNITNIGINKDWELHQCTISNSKTALIQGNNTILGHPVKIQNCSINISEAYMIFNSIDTEVPIIQNSIIICDSDGVISLRETQQENIKFINCIISVKSRLSYSPDKQDDVIISFINCILLSKHLEFVLLTASEAVKLDIVNCTLNGDTINIPASPNNIGTSLKRPINKGIGQIFFDKTLNKPIWWTGIKWVDATGADV